MRFALSAMAAVSGVILFAMAYFGQPESYLRHARQQWDAWIDFEPSDPVANQDEGRNTAALAEQVQALQDEVSRLKDRLGAKQATAEATQETPPTPNPASRPSQAAQALLATPDASVATPTTIPERRTVTPAAERRDAAGRSPGVMPSKSIPVRPEPDDTRSVLARLRQAPPASAMELPEERPKPVGSPVMSRLAAAQAAFSNGRIEDARRLLQEAQLLLVFRPAGSSGDDVSAAGKGSVDIAHALEALGNNDIVRSRLSVDRAIDDMAGAGTDAPEREAMGKRTGYAPAYPPR